MILKIKRAKFLQLMELLKIWSKLNATLWESKVPLAATLDDDSIDAFRDDFLLPGIKHQPARHTLLSLETVDSGCLMDSLAEEIGDLLGDDSLRTLSGNAAENWPGQWKEAIRTVNRPKRRVMIIEGISQLNRFDEKEIHEFLSVLKSLAIETKISVLAIVSQQETPACKDIPGFEAKMCGSVYPIATAPNKIARTIGLSVFSAGVLGLVIGGVNVLSPQSNEPTLIQIPQTASIDSKPNTPTEDVVSEGQPNQDSADASTTKLEIKPEPVEEVPEIEVVEIPLPIDAIVKTEFPLGEMLDLFEPSPDLSSDDLGQLFETLIEKHPDRDFAKIENWIEQLQNAEESFEFIMAEKCSELEKTDKAYLWNTYWAEKAPSAEAMYRVGGARLLGLGTEEDPGSAVNYLDKSQQQGHSDATYLYGLCHLFGHGVPQDHKKAFTTFLSAQKQGSTLVYRELGRLSEKGIGTPQDKAAAIKYYEAGAENKEPYCIERFNALTNQSNPDELPQQHSMHVAVEKVFPESEFEKLQPAPKTPTWKTNTWKPQKWKSKSPCGRF